MMIRKRRLTPNTESILKQKRVVSGLREEEIIEHAVKEIPIENLLFISRIKSRKNDEKE